MLLGRLLVSEAVALDYATENKDTQLKYTDRISPRSWGIISDVSAIVLGVLTFGPPWYSREALYDDEGLVNAAQWGYLHPVEQHAIFPAQLVSMCLFLYGLLHNRGMVAAVLRWDPLDKFGLVCYPFFLLHYPITAFTLANGPYSASQVSNLGYLAFDVNNQDIGSVLPLGGLALTYVVAYLVNEYYQQAIMRWVEPLASRVFAPLERWFRDCSGPPCLRRVELQSQYSAVMQTHQDQQV